LQVLNETVHWAQQEVLRLGYGYSDPRDPPREEQGPAPQEDLALEDNEQV
jgi:hypothetical protein